MCADYSIDFSAAAYNRFIQTSTPFFCRKKQIDKLQSKVDTYCKTKYTNKKEKQKY